MKTPNEPSRKERILDAAERAFADFGFEGASMRRIVLDAGVNLATVYYYFASKEGLMVAVLKRRFDPLMERQIETLRKLVAGARGGPVPLGRIIHTLIAPILGMAESSTGIERQLIGRVLTEPSEQIQELLCSQYHDVRELFLEQFKRTLPKIPITALTWRLECTWGAVAALLCNPRKIRQRTDGCCDPSDTKQLIAHLLPFFTAGFRAPVSSSHP